MPQLNPFAKVETTRGPAGNIDGLRIIAPVKGRGLQTTWIERKDDPPAFSRTRRTVLTALLDAEQGRDAWSAADAHDRDVLHCSGLFVEADEMPSAVEAPETSTETVLVVGPGPAEDMTRRGFAVIPGAVRDRPLAALQEYYAAIVAEGFARYGGEGGEPHRWVLHNDPAARRLQSSFTALVSSVAGERLKPSFAYLLTYLEGASLDAHRDREQCAVTAVLQVDFDPRPSGASPWPLHFRRDGRVDSAHLAIGDLIVFRGADVEHYRDTFTCGRSSTNLAFCFVPIDFRGSLD
jgi:hypothetical protein